MTTAFPQVSHSLAGRRQWSGRGRVFLSSCKWSLPPTKLHAGKGIHQRTLELFVGFSLAYHTTRHTFCVLLCLLLKKQKRHCEETGLLLRKRAPVVRLTRAYHRCLGAGGSAHNRSIRPGGKTGRPFLGGAGLPVFPPLHFGRDLIHMYKW